jgi:Ca-activated chloride channel family protein
VRRITLALICAILSLPAAVWTSGAQSGRKKTPNPTRRVTVHSDPINTVDSYPEPQPIPIPKATREASVTVPATEDDAPPPRATPAPTPAAKPDEIDDDEVVRVSSNLVPVPATITDAEGASVTDLELKDFELKVDGVVKPIGDLSRSETPVTMAFLYDNSASLRAGREFEKRAAVAFFRRVMRPVDRAAVFSISTVPQRALPLTGDVRALVRTVENFGQPHGATALFDTIAEAAKYLKPYTGRKVIVIVSDGTDTVSELGFDETLRRVIAADCQVYSVQTGHSENTNLRDLAGERRLQEFAASTGGGVYVPHSPAEFDTAFGQIAAALAQQYILGYYPSDDRRDGRFHAITLRVATRPALRVRTRKGYYSPKG